MKRRATKKGSNAEFSDSEGDKPAKMLKLAEAEGDISIGPMPFDPSRQIAPSIRVTPKAEVKELDPTLMSHLGFMNRNRRPPSSKVKEILNKVDQMKKQSNSYFYEAKKRHN
mmetsp:Transcript_32942/g.57734  ORF Transcript_32942/g.57734 Transcript_32942/m.57734 type:complete len:112 (+) Transcript_32942:1324-1659(+)|eukprot:CAMPEP_0204917036 /NCGR_PEP_ID=MMETSP1397-20131031/14728_1 /ASSEMBLY_ACC=CAM_ASM_000891 /TAXON_ID=49980 /ORGANISM="Climacostomum Climacostomum virens, Strain Stock W-24" /LENGTH=111 /DNA_ID=CAMNT_0052089767 /DNA_START=244 /DNA_END=579 /DNA_ORIENTATION=+